MAKLTPSKRRLIYSGVRTARAYILNTPELKAVLVLAAGLPPPTRHPRTSSTGMPASAISCSRNPALFKAQMVSVRYSGIRRQRGTARVVMKQLGERGPKRAYRKSILRVQLPVWYSASSVKPCKAVFVLSLPAHCQRSAILDESYRTFLRADCWKWGILRGQLG